MGKWTGFWLVGLLMTVAWLGALGSAALHDQTCMPAGEEGSDASNTRASAKKLVDFACRGEMLAGADDHDWYFIEGVIGTAGEPFTIGVCPSVTKSAPWDANLEVVSKTVFSTPLPSSIGGFQYSLITNKINAVVDGMYPVEPVGESTDDGCDAIEISGEMNQVQNPFLPTRYFIHVTRDSGDGFYDLTVA